MKIIHITDPHVRPAGESLLGIDTGDRFSKVIQDVNTRHADADLVAITGDLTHYGEPAAYARVAELLKGLRLPYRLMLGNHDRRPAFRNAFPDHPIDDNGFVQSIIDPPGLGSRLLFLDTHEEGYVGGRLCEKRLGWLERRLDEAQDRPVVLFQHHPPLSVGAAHFNNICMAEPQPFLQALRTHGRVRHIFLGHVHIPVTGSFAGGIPFTAGRGCSHQMVLDMEHPDAPWTNGVANYNIILLGEDDLYIHAFDMIDAPKIGTAIAPPGP